VNASQFDFMGMSVRTAAWRYIEWRTWDGTRVKPDWTGPAVATELYAHAADGVGVDAAGTGIGGVDDDVGEGGGGGGDCGRGGRATNGTCDFECFANGESANVVADPANSATVAALAARIRAVFG
jgi:hypothetical protein